MPSRYMASSSPRLRLAHYSAPQVRDHLSCQAASRSASLTLARIFSKDFGVQLKG